MSDEKIISKIAALLAKAESTTNEFEAEAFMAKVNELLEKHQIELHQLSKDSDPMGQQFGNARLSKSESWVKSIAANVARYYNAEIVWWTVGNNIIYKVIGTESARATTELMLPYVLTQIRRAGRKLAARDRVAPAVSIREVAHALTNRLRILVWERKEHRNDLVGKGLVPVSDVAAYMNEHFSETKMNKPVSGRFSADAREAAEKISLHAQATGRHVKLLK